MDTLVTGRFLVWSRPSFFQKVSLSKELNPKLAPESLVYECEEVIIPPNEKVVSTASVKWTKLSRKASHTYSPLNRYSSFSMRGKCFCNLFICRCCKWRLLLQYLQLSSPFFTVAQTDFFSIVWDWLSLQRWMHVFRQMALLSIWVPCSHLNTQVSLSGLAGQCLEKGLGFYGTQ